MSFSWTWTVFSSWFVGHRQSAGSRDPPIKPLPALVRHRLRSGSGLLECYGQQMRIGPDDQRCDSLTRMPEITLPKTWLKAKQTALTCSTQSGAMQDTEKQLASKATIHAANAQSRRLPDRLTISIVIKLHRAGTKQLFDWPKTPFALLVGLFRRCDQQP